MTLILKGRAWKYGDNLGNDVELLYPRFGEPAVDPKEHVMEGIDPEFPKKVKPGDILVAGKHFAHGQPHIGPFYGFKGLGIGLVVESIVRGALRNAVNAGVPLLPYCKDITKKIDTGDNLEVNFSTGEIRNLTKEVVLNTQPLQSELLEIVEAGGFVGWLRKKYQSA